MPLKVCSWLTENYVIPPKIPLAIKWLVVALVTVCHSLPVILAFVSSPHFNTWSYSKLSSTRQSVDERLKEKWVYGHVVNDLPTNTGLMYSIFTILLTIKIRSNNQSTQIAYHISVLPSRTYQQIQRNASVTTATCQSTSDKSLKKDRSSLD